MNFFELHSLLEEKHEQYNRHSFIENDPISVPHRFRKKEDIEIAGFLSSALAWGQRKATIASANKLVKMMDDAPHDFILNFTNSDLKPFRKFKHRTFNGTDCIFFLLALHKIYKRHRTLENVFYGENVKFAIINFRRNFFSLHHPARTRKHISNPAANSACKRLNLFLRWMTRNDQRGVDFGIWKKLSPKNLICPLDVHSGNVARKLGLLNRNQNDWQAAEELTSRLRELSPEDPVKYDFALFGLGIFEKF